ncbi:hypothetical protein TcasGA2_TC015555 [Tribolium castaneum]|uniref:Uncharacterized protein n=1 Tax=Tribolium castaneum TaxID=7070 RepID=D2A5K5_TRICA|nr:PREDICTED: uncharacterized protein LOC103312185 [Tribolium castaneum]EFA05383.2 hypothetical protein TcasGA2_TC015555 [Tribolium castaneum]|eukprot:XP_008190420.1 PREDICTED: uncharacterized protein LOC103312185 [Tribolium castaneum]
MSRFNFLFVLFMVALAESSLVARFTSNPFFLRHFSGVYERPAYVPILSNSEIPLSSNDNEETDQEENTFEPTVFNSEESSEEVSDNTEPVIPIFKILPLYEKTQVFRKIEPKITSRANQIAVTYYFNSLPHFESSHVFRTVVARNEELGANFRILPHFDAARFARRRLVRVVKKKKVEFGQRLRPRIEDFSSMQNSL